MTVDNTDSRPRGRISATQRAYQWIRDAVLSGELPEGAILEEEEISYAVGTSRTPVREAFNRLQAERYIDLIPRHGARVRVIDARELAEIYATRYVLEAHALQEICARQRGNPPSAAALIDDFEASLPAADWPRVALLDQSFHRSYIAHNGNSVLTDLYDNLQARQVRLSLRTLTTMPSRLPIIIREHRALWQAVDSHDADRATAILAQHLRPVPQLIAKLPATP